MARVMYFDCFAGAAGDMVLGALIDAGLPLEALTRALGSLEVGHQLKATKVVRAGITATHVDLVATAGHDDGHRHLERPATPHKKDQQQHHHHHHGHSHKHESSEEQTPDESEHSDEKCAEGHCVFMAAAKTSVAKITFAALLPLLLDAACLGPSAQFTDGAVDPGGFIALPVRIHLLNQVLLI